MKFKFAHIADLHLGSFREKRLTQLNFLAFRKAIDISLQENVEYVLFCGDMFNTAIPSIDLVTLVAQQLMRIKNNGIRIYIIGGSHDYSDSGKSFLELLEATGVFVNTCKYELVGKDKYKLISTYDAKTNSSIYGILGRKRELEKNIYKNIEKIDLKESNFNVFMFHSALSDLKPDFMREVQIDISSSFLPKGFDFYAGGHVHSVINSNYDAGKISYPGALFPNNFSELKREKPGFNLCEFDFEKRDLKIKRINLDIYEKLYIKIDVDSMNSIDAKNEIFGEIEKYDFKDKLVLLEILGIIEGNTSDLKLNEIISNIYDKGAFQVLKNSYKLRSLNIEINSDLISDDVNDLEEKIIQQYLKDDLDFDKKKILLKNLLNQDFSKIDEEKNVDYEERVVLLLDKFLK